MTEHPREEMDRVAARLHVSYTDPAFASELDRLDRLAPLRDEFFYPKNKHILGVDLTEISGDEDCVYFNGNSLGLQPKAVTEYIRAELDKWATRGVQGHRTGDFPWAESDVVIAPRMAPLLGSRPSEIALMNGLTVNLHLLLISFYRPTATRHKILMENKAFPADHYTMESQIRLHGYDPTTSLICLAPREGEWTLRPEDILEVIEKEGDSISVILLPGIQYYTGQMFDIETITRAGHDKGCYVGFDLAHSVGNHPLHLHDWDVDFAVWCTYKYLCGGAGSLAGAFLHDKFDTVELTTLRGWWGHQDDTRFKMDNVGDFTPGIQGYRLSNPSIMAIIPLAPFLDVYEKTNIEEIRSKSVLLTGYLEALLQHLQQETRDAGLPTFNIITPSDPNQRAAQLSLHFNEKVSHLLQHLLRFAIVVGPLHELSLPDYLQTDFRAPYVVRFAPCPLYNSYTDVYQCYSRLKQALYCLINS